MSKLLVQLPDQTQALLSVAADTLVYDGQYFVQPSAAKYVALYSVPIAATTLPFGGLESNLAYVASQIKAGVLNYNPVEQLDSDPSLVIEPDPSLGICVCFITCKGTFFSYVQVTST